MDWLLSNFGWYRALIGGKWYHIEGRYGVEMWVRKQPPPVVSVDRTEEYK